MTDVQPIADSQIARAAEAIRHGQVVAFPTETVYGLGANAWDAEAVAHVFERKGRPRFDPLIVHLALASPVHEIVASLPKLAERLIEHFWPGPLSLVLPKRPRVPDIVTAGLPSVAVRCPDHPIAQRLLAEASVPIAAPSANRFGEISPTNASHVRQQFGDPLLQVLDAGPSRIGLESTVISFVDGPHGRPVLLRPGGVTLEQLQEVVGRVETAPPSAERPSSPGQLTRHYSPRTPLTIAREPINEAVHRVRQAGHQEIGLLAWREPGELTTFSAIEVLSPSGCLREAGVNLFAAMRRLDALALDCLIAEPVPEEGLGRAIMDRLRRASAPSLSG